MQSYEDRCCPCCHKKRCGASRATRWAYTESLRRCVSVAAALPSGLAWLLFGASMQRLLRSPRAARLFNIAMGISLAASVAFILW